MDIGEMQKRLSLKAHIRPRCVFGWKPDADKPENLWTLCLKHHTIKTENDRQRESRVP